VDNVTSPNISLTSPKKFGRSQKKNMLLPQKLGEVCKKNVLLPKQLGEVKKQTYFSQKSWEKYVKKMLVHFLSLKK
jgi:hypothetical protein